MKKQLLKSFFAFLILNAAFLISANAQIVYHDIIPDVTHTCSVNPCSQTYNLDLNNDGITDYIIESHNSGGLHSHSSSVSISPQGNNLFASTSLNTVKKLSQFDSIGTTQLWHAGAEVFKSFHFPPPGGSNQGEWNSAVNKYVGLKLIVGGQNYFGWARLNVNVVLGSASFTIKDYAYNSIPNQSILAGSPTISVSGVSSICKGDSATLFVSQGTSFLWSTGETTSTITVNPSATTTYTVVVNDSIFGFTTTLSQQIIVKLNTFIIQGGNDSLIAIVVGGLSTSTSQWVNCATNLQIAGATSHIFIPASTGSYAVIVNKDGCTDTSNCIAVAFQGINENHFEPAFSLYPNPATNSVTIKIPSDEAGEIQIINLFGRVVETHNYASLRDDELQIDVSKFPAGMYVVRWSSGENYKTKIFSVIK